MALTPIDVQQKTFGTALRGYDLDEVDDFLDEVVTSLKSYEERLVEAQERIGALQAELEGKGDSESAISRALVTAQRSADALVAEAQADAARIKTDAQVEADRLLEEAHAERAQLDAARAAEQAKLDVEVARMRDGIAAIRTRVLDLNAAIGSNLDEMDQAVADAGVDSVEDAPAGEPTVADETTPLVLAEVTSDEGAKWYESPGATEATELDLGLPPHDDIAADETTADATTEMTSPDEPVEAGTEPPSDAGDALDDAIAEATFQAEDTDEGWEEHSEEAAESWDEVWGSDDDDRPRRPWE